MGSRACGPARRGGIRVEGLSGEDDDYSQCEPLRSPAGYFERRVEDNPAFHNYYPEGNSSGPTSMQPVQLMSCHIRALVPLFGHQRASLAPGSTIFSESLWSCLRIGRWQTLQIGLFASPGYHESAQRDCAARRFEETRVAASGSWGGGRGEQGGSVREPATGRVAAEAAFGRVL